MSANLYDHLCNAVKGWPAPYALDKHADLDEDSARIYKGRCMYINEDGELTLGLACGAVGILATRDSGDRDVAAIDGNTVGGVMAGIVVLGPYEVETTEFDDTQTYAPNDYLTAINTAGDDQGLITLGTAYEDTIVGIVSDGVVVAPYSQDVLRFWTYHLRPVTCPSPE